MATVFPISQCDFSHENVGALFPPLEEGQAGRLMTTAEETLWLPRARSQKATQLLPAPLGCSLWSTAATNSMKMPHEAFRLTALVKSIYIHAEP